MKIWVYSYFCCWSFSSCGMWCHIMGVEFEIFWRIIVPLSSGLGLSTFQMIKALDISKCQEPHTQQHSVSSQTLEPLPRRPSELQILHLCNCLSVIRWYSLALSCRSHIFCCVLTLNNDYMSVWCHQLTSIPRTYLPLGTRWWRCVYTIWHLSFQSDFSRSWHSSHPLWKASACLVSNSCYWLGMIWYMAMWVCGADKWKVCKTGEQYIETNITGYL